MKQQDKGPVIIIGELHLNTLGLVRSVGEAGYRDIIVIEKCPLTSNDYIAKSKYIKRIFHVQAYNEALPILESLKDEYSNCPIPILTMSDAGAEFIDLHYNLLSINFICPNIKCGQGELHKMLSKERMAEVASSCGLTCPRAWTINVENINNIPQDISYPCIIKPIESAHGRKDYGIYYNDTDLRKALLALFECSPMIQIQEYIEKDYEFIINGVSDGQAHTLTGVIKKIRQYPLNNGGFAFGKYIPLETLNDDLIAKINKFLTTLKYDGIFSIEFIMKGEKSYFLEINLRNDATSYLMTAMGFNLADIWISAHNDIALSKSKRKRANKYVCNSLRDYGNVKSGSISAFNWIVSTLRSSADSFFNIKDFRPCMSIIFKR